VSETVSAARRQELTDKYDQAEAAFKDGKLVAARGIYSEIVDQGLKSDENHKIVKRLEELADKMIFSNVHIDGDALTEMFDVPPGGVADRIAARKRIGRELLRKVNDLNDKYQLQANQKIKVINGPFHVVVDKSDFTLTLFLKDPNTKKPVFIKRFTVGLGQDNSTPTGTWYIRNMELNPDWRNPKNGKFIKPDEAGYPLGKPGRWIGLAGKNGNAKGTSGYGIHGTPERDSMGKMASMGCVRMLDEDVAQVWMCVRIRQGGDESHDTEVVVQD